MSKRRWCIVVLGLTGTAICTGCPGAAGARRESDVPSLTPDAWGSLGFGMQARPGASGDGSLLLTNITAEQDAIDSEDGIFGNGPHGPVYRFDPATGEFELVDDTAWEVDSEPVTDCLFSTGTESPFTIEGFQLQYDGRAVDVAGASAVALRVAPEGPVVNVLSADGVRPVPFFGVRSFDGPHYHELFSEIDGSRVGSAIKVGVGSSRDSAVRICWTLDEEYVIYYDLAGVDVFKLCVVPVGDTLREEGLKVEP